MGLIFVNLLIEQCKTLYPTKKIALYVLDENTQARSCYKKAGFEFTSDKGFRINFKEKEFEVKKMLLGANTYS